MTCKDCVFLDKRDDVEIPNSGGLRKNTYFQITDENGDNPIDVCQCSNQQTTVGDIFRASPYLYFFQKYQQDILKDKVFITEDDTCPNFQNEEE